MKKILLKYTGIILTIFAIILLFWGFLCLEDIQHKLTVVAISAGILTTIVSVYTVVYNQKMEKEREYEKFLLQEKQKIFEYFYDSMFIAIKQTKDNRNENKKNTETSNELVEKQMMFKKGLMNWGSENIIKKYIEFDNKLIDSLGKNDKSFIVKEADSFLKELRKELGFKDSKDLSIWSIILSPEARKEFRDKGFL